MLLLLLLCGCGAANETAETPLALRTSLNGADGCSFTLALQADFGDYTRSFTLDCAGNAEEMEFTVTEPETVAGIQATIQGADAQVCYQDTILAVEDLEALSPMSAPLLLAQALSQGYIAQWGADGDREQVTYRLGYGQSQVTVQVWFGEQVPVQAEISDGENVLITCEISQFTLQKKAKNHENTETAETDLGGGEP
jgi:hypothetical protein